MKNTNKVILGAIVLLLSNGIALSSAFANAPAATTEVVQEAVKESTSDIAKEAVGEVVDSTKEKAIGMAKEQASKAVDAGMDKAAEAINTTEKAVDAAKEATK